MYRLHNSKTDGIPALGGGSGHDLQSPTQKLFQIDNHSQRKTQFSPKEYLWVYKPHSPVGQLQMNSMLLQRVFGFLSLFVCSESHNTIPTKNKNKNSKLPADLLPSVSLSHPYCCNRISAAALPLCCLHLLQIPQTIPWKPPNPLASIPSLFPISQGPTPQPPMLNHRLCLPEEQVECSKTFPNPQSFPQFCSRTPAADFSHPCSHSLLIPQIIFS